MSVPRNRRAYTLVETLVAAAVGLGVLAVMTTLWTATRRMSNVGDLSSALSLGAQAMETLHRDLAQAVQKPGEERMVVVSKEAFQFIRGDRRLADGVLTGTLVVYRREKTAGGHFRLVRSIGAERTPLPGTYSAIDVSTFKGVGGPYARVTLHVVARDVANSDPTRGIDEAVLTSLVRVAGPEMMNSKLLNFRFMEELKTVSLLKGTDGF